MRKLQLVLLAAFLLLCTLLVTAQTANPSAIFTVIIVNEQKEPLEGAVVDVLKTADKKLIKSAVTNKNGVSVFYIGLWAEQQLSVTYMGYEAQRVLLSKTKLADKQLKIILRSNAKTLDNVSVNSRKPFIQQVHGKTIVNVDASVTNAGTTILEILEKSPGVMVDKDGSISLQGKAGVMVMIDDKPVFVSGSDLNNLLSGMSSLQVEQIELITSPSAKYDASGNAGIINIKTKKNKQVGFNRTVSSSFAQGRLDPYI